MNGTPLFDLSSVFSTVAGAVPDQDVQLNTLSNSDSQHKTAQTFPTVNGIRWSVPGDRARILADGRIELLGRDSLTINSGGERIYVEEVERAIAAHPAVTDVVVVGRPSTRWGSEAVAIIAVNDETSVTDTELIDTCRGSIADYKIPKAFIRAPMMLRSPAGKADYRWAAALGAAHT